jgi:hypothetical protein
MVFVDPVIFVAFRSAKVRRATIVDERGPSLVESPPNLSEGLAQPQNPAWQNLLFMPKCFDGIHHSRSSSWIKPEQETDPERNEHRKQNRPQRDAWL